MASTTLEQGLLAGVGLTQAATGLATTRLYPNMLPTLEAQPQGALAPARYAFAIWGPIFLGIGALSLEQARERFAYNERWHAARWPLIGSFACGVAWPAVVNKGYTGLATCLQLGMLAGAATAYRTLIPDNAPVADTEERLTVRWPLGLYTGWLTVATFANLDATFNGTQGSSSEEAATRRAMVLVGAASGTAAAMAVATRGNLGYAGAAAWGLGGILLRNRREQRPAVVRTAAIGLSAVALATILARRLRG